MFLKEIIDVGGKFEENFQLTTSYWSMISSLLHLVGLRARVNCTLTIYIGGGGRGGNGNVFVIYIYI